MTYFNTRFQGASVPMTDARQTKQFLENIKNQEQQRKDRAKVLAEDQKRLSLIAQGLGLQKGEVDSMSRGELQGFIDATLQKKQQEQNLQAHNMSLAKFKLDQQKASTNEMIGQAQLMNANTNQLNVNSNITARTEEINAQQSYGEGLQNFLRTIGGQPPPTPQGPQATPPGGSPTPGAPINPGTINKFSQGTGSGPAMPPPPPPNQSVPPGPPQGQPPGPQQGQPPGPQQMSPQQKMLLMSQSGMNPKTMNSIAEKVLPDLINPPEPSVNTRQTADEAMMKTLGEVAIKDYNDWQVNGGIEGAREKMKRINSIKQKLSSGQIKTGRLINAIGGIFEKFLDPEAVGAKQALETIFQENLRETIGAQFTENEAKMFLARAYDPALPNKTNIEKINYALSQMTTLQNYKAQYFGALQTNGAEGVRSFKFDPNKNLFDNDSQETQLQSGNRGSSFTPPSIPGSNVKLIP